MLKTKKVLFLAGTALAILFFAGSAYAATTTNTNKGDRPTGGSDGRQGNAIIGTVASISDTTIKLTVNKPAANKNTNSEATSTTYTIDASSATIKKMASSSADSNTNGAKPSETTITISDITVGNTLMVNGEISGTSIKAKEITVGSFSGGQPNGADNGQDKNSGIRGTVSAISGTTINITSEQRENKNSNTAPITYTIDASNATFKEMASSTGSSGSTDTIISISDISVGDVIEVTGTVSGTKITATSILKGSGEKNLSPPDNSNTNQNSNTNGTVNSSSHSSGFFSKIFDGFRSFFKKLFNK